MNGEIAEKKKNIGTHHGQAVRSIREILGIKQNALADLLNVTQQYISKVEGKERIEDTTLEKIATALEVPVELIKNFDRESAVNLITNNTFHFEASDNAQETMNLNLGDSEISNQTNIDPMGKIIELYTQLLEEKDKKIAELEKQLKKYSH